MYEITKTGDTYHVETLNLNCKMEETAGRAIVLHAYAAINDGDSIDRICSLIGSVVKVCCADLVGSQLEMDMTEAYAIDAFLADYEKAQATASPAVSKEAVTAYTASDAMQKAEELCVQSYAYSAEGYAIAHSSIIPDSMKSALTKFRNEMIK